MKSELLGNDRCVGSGLRRRQLTIPHWPLMFLVWRDPDSCPGREGTAGGDRAAAGGSGGAEGRQVRGAVAPYIASASSEHLWSGATAPPPPTKLFP